MATGTVKPPPGYVVHPSHIHPDSLPPDFKEWDEPGKKGLHKEALPPHFDQWDGDKKTSHKLAHPAGTVTAWDEETGLPIVKRHDNGGENLTTQKNLHNSSTSNDVEKEEVGEIDPDSGRVITSPEDKLGPAQKLATEAAPELKAKLEAAIKPIHGAKLEGVREEKDPKRAREKATKEDKPVETIPDLLAARISVDKPEVRTPVVAALKSAFPVVKEEDQFEKGDPDYGFRSHTLQVEMGNGASAEVQIVPRPMMHVESETHDNYEKGRKAEASGGDAQQYMAANKKIHDAAMANFKPDSPPKQELAKGSHVLLPDGRSAKVQFYDRNRTKNARVTAADGEEIQSIPGKQLRPVMPISPGDGEWIGVDLDATLARYHGFKGIENIGKPVPEMVERVKQWLKDGEDVRIFTARIANDPDGKAREAIEAWSQHYLGTALPITNVKDDKMKELWDDRARQVQPNTGKLVGKPEESIQETKLPKNHVLVKEHVRRLPGA